MARNMGKVGGVAAGGAGLALLAACSSDSGAAPMTPDQIRSVLMELSEFPGGVESFDEHFGDTPRDLSQVDDWESVTELLGEGQCTDAMESIGGVDGENSPQASGERRVFIEPDPEDDEEDYPVLRVSITSYEDEASVDEYWDEIQEACGGTILETDSDYQQQVTLEPYEIGEFRGLTGHWVWESSSGTGESTHYGLSYAHGHQVIRIDATDLSEAATEEVLTRQIELLEEGPAEQDGRDAADFDDRDLPEGEMSSDNLAQLVLQGEDFPFPVAEGSLEEGVEALSAEYSTWGFAVMSAVAPAVPAGEEAMSSECEHHWQGDSGNFFVENEPGEGVALSTALQPERINADSGNPSGAVVLLMSHGTPSQDPEAHWASFLEACAGEHEYEQGTQVLEGLDIDGVHGFTAHMTQQPGEHPEEFTSHFAHLEFGHNSLRIVGIDLTTDQMREVVIAQLDKLEQAH